MSTAFNNQWVLGRAHSRRRGRAPLTARLGHPGEPRAGELQGPEAPERHPSHELQPSQEAGPPGETGPAGPDAAFTARAVRKRPRWIDRDT